jgi:hypothetical protein
VAGDVQKGETMTPCGNASKSASMEISTVFAGINLDTNERVAEVNLVASSVRS